MLLFTLFLQTFRSSIGDGRQTSNGGPHSEFLSLSEFSTVGQKLAGAARNRPAVPPPAQGDWESYGLVVLEALLLYYYYNHYHHHHHYYYHYHHHHHYSSEDYYYYYHHHHHYYYISEDYYYIIITPLLKKTLRQLHKARWLVRWKLLELIIIIIIL